MHLGQTIFITGSLLLTGCSLLSSALGGGAAPEPGTNPLGGTALSLPSVVLDGQSCDRDLGNPQLLLTATEAEICIQEAVMVPTHPDAPPFGGSPEIVRLVLGDTDDKEKLTLTSSGPPINVSRCSSDAGEQVWWRQDFEGCMPNNGSITAATEALGLHRNDERVDGFRRPVPPTLDARFVAWKFGTP